MRLIEISVSASIMIVFVIIVRTLALYKLPKITFVALWSMVLTRLMITAYIPFPNCPGLPAPFASPPIFNRQSLFPLIGISTFFTLLWVVVALIIFFFLIGTHIIALKKHKSSIPVESQYIKTWMKLHPLRRKLHIRQSQHIYSAVTYGIVNPTILLPASTDWNDEEKLCYILTHEYMHVKHFDVLIKWLLVFSFSIHWFNPLVWLMYLLFNRDIELYCDECVVRLLGLNIRSSYAKTLIAIKKNTLIIVPPSVRFSGGSFEERITAIMKNKTKTLTTICLMAILIGGIVLAGFTADSGTDLKSFDYQANNDPPIIENDTYLKAGEYQILYAKE